MRLIYINKIGVDYKFQYQYEFIFSLSEEIEMDSWLIIPSTSTDESKTPDVDYIDKVGLLKDVDLDLELIHDSDYFGVIDAIDGVISLGWEKFDYDLEVSRLYFKFGETIDSVTKKLNKRGFKLKIEDIQK